MFWPLSSGCGFSASVHNPARIPASGSECPKADCPGHFFEAVQPPARALHRLSNALFYSFRRVVDPKCFRTGKSFLTFAGQTKAQSFLCGPDRLVGVSVVIEFMGTVQGGAVKFDVTVDVFLIHMGGNKEFVLPAGKLQSKLIVQFVRVLRRDFPRLKGLDN